MEPNSEEILHQFPLFKVYKDGRVVKPYWPPQYFPPSDDPSTGVRSKDVTISTDPKVTARIFLPQIPDPKKKIPAILYIHGGGFSMMSPFAPPYDQQGKLIAAEANALVVSVDYRLAPENPMPACYDDCWEALKWIASHSTGDGPEQWVNDHADFDRVFVGGDSAGGNFSHTLAYRVGTIGLPGTRLVGAFMIHPFFGGVEEHDKMWMYMCPTNKGFDDPLMKPSVEDLGIIGCDKVLVFVAGECPLRDPGVAYYERLQKSSWKGHAELVEHEGEGHCFHLYKPTKPNAVAILKKIVSFVNENELEIKARLKH